MRYVVWGPVAGIVIASVLFILGLFGTNTNLTLIVAGVLVVLGLVIGWFMDSKAE